MKTGSFCVDVQHGYGTRKARAVGVVVFVTSKKGQGNAHTSKQRIKRELGKYILLFNY